MTGSKTGTKVVGFVKKLFTDAKRGEAGSTYLVFDMAALAVTLLLLVWVLVAA